jgi:hypothetical protein
VPRVFARDQCDVSQDLDGAVSDVREISDRRGDEIKSTGHASHILIPFPCFSRWRESGRGDKTDSKPVRRTGKGPGVAEAFERKFKNG